MGLRSEDVIEVSFWSFDILVELLAFSGWSLLVDKVVGLLFWGGVGLDSHIAAE